MAGAGAGKRYLPAVLARKDTGSKWVGCRLVAGPFERSPNCWRPPWEHRRGYRDHANTGSTSTAFAACGALLFCSAYALLFFRDGEGFGRRFLALVDQWLGDPGERDVQNLASALRG